MSLINDLTKEYIKDIVGQYIVYYPVSVLKTNVDLVYGEAVEKIFNNPIKVDALVGQVDRENAYDKFSIYQNSAKVEVLLQARDLLDKNISINIGDFFVYGSTTFEIMDVVNAKNIFGQEDYSLSYVVKGDAVSATQFDINVFNKMWDDTKDFRNKLDKVFEQQRGLPETDNNGATADVRQVRERLGDDMAPIALNEGPRKIVPDNIDNPIVEPEVGNSFYNE